MTIGRKIVSGYTLVLVLFAVVATISYIAAQRVGQGVNNFSSSTAEAAVAADLEGEMLRKRMIVSDYLIRPEESAIEQYMAEKKQLQATLLRAGEIITEPDRVAEIEKAAKLIDSYDAAFAKVTKLYAERNEVDTQILTPQRASLNDTLVALTQDARRSGDQVALAKGSAGLQQLFGAVASVNSFLLTQDPLNVKEVRDSLAALKASLDGLATDLKEMEELDASLVSPEAKARVAKLQASHVAYAAGFDRIVGVTERTAKIQQEELMAIAPQFSNTVRSLSVGLQSLQRNLGSDLSELQDRTQALVLGISIAGLFAGILGGFVVTRSVNRPIFGIAERLTEGADLSSSAATQVSSASQVMADGSSRQAASLEESSASLEEMGGMTKRNAENAAHAKELARETRKAAETGAVDMGEMQTAMQAIQKSSQEVSKIIKTIDEIAFQTNLLALNAAVEAARAGEAGLGFAVVAEEVRSLAQRSVQAARETAQKISDATTNSENGARLSERVANSLAGITTKAREVDEIIAEIATATAEQSQGIDQVTRAVSDMDQVTQGNAATASQTSTAAAELDVQTSRLKEVIAELNSMVGTSRAASKADKNREKSSKGKDNKNDAKTQARSEVSGFTRQGSGWGRHDDDDGDNAIHSPVLEGKSKAKDPVMFR